MFIVSILVNNLYYLVKERPFALVHGVEFIGWSAAKEVDEAVLTAVVTGSSYSHLVNSLSHLQYASYDLGFYGVLEHKIQWIHHLAMDTR